MESIFTEFNAGMEHIYNTFFISFLALKPFQEKPFLKDYIIPIKGLAHNRLEASQLNALGEDSIIEYLNAIKRHTLNDIVICYERYATLMITSHENNKIRKEVAVDDNRHINSTVFEKLENLYSDSDLIFFQQLKRLRNSLVHYNAVYNKANKLDYVFFNSRVLSEGHEGENIVIDLDSVVWIHEQVVAKVKNINLKYHSLYFNK